MRRIYRAFTAAFLAVFFCSASSESVLETFSSGLCGICRTAYAQSVEEPTDLYALSAVLMDAQSGRVLFEKDGYTARPMASTTKVMTCILAIENAPGDDYVQVSANAASQPEVKLGMAQGEQYYLEDLLYSLMLKSHNDTAVAIAEHIGGSVEGFADMMNAKAEELGCEDTHFVTPNGLDASDEGGEHRTTAADLARIMRYAISNSVFVRITQTREYSFSDLSGKRQFSVQNANAFLDMTDGVISGKTGYTGNAGYCYVCACEKDGKTFIVALLGCGWPNNKTYKWKDTMKLLNYGAESFSYRTIYKDCTLPSLVVKNGVSPGKWPSEDVQTTLTLSVSGEQKSEQLLLRKDAVLKYQVELPETLEAPVAAGEEVGSVVCYANDEEVARYPVLADQAFLKLTFSWCAETVFHAYFP